MKRVLKVILVGVFLTLTAPLSTVTQTVVFEDDFESYHIGEAPYDYYAYWGGWEVRAEGGNQFYHCYYLWANYLMSQRTSFSGMPYWQIEYKTRHYPRPVTPGPNPRPEPVSIGIRFSDKVYIGGAGSPYLTAYLWADSEGQICVNEWFKNPDGTLYNVFLYPGTHELMLEPDVWYDMKVIVSERTVQLFIDGAFVFKHEFNEEVSVGYFEGPWHLYWFSAGYRSLDDFVVCQLPPPEIEAIVDIDPDVVNLSSNANWVTAYVELPNGYDVVDIDISTVLLNNEVPAEAWPYAVGDHDADGIPDLMMKFDKIAAQGTFVIEGYYAEVTVAGELNDDTKFGGTDTVRVK